MFNWDMTIPIATLAELGLLGWTLYFLRKYTKETGRSVEELKGQNKLQLHPIVVLKFGRRPLPSNGEEGYMAGNVGRGVAVNIEMRCKINKEFEGVTEYGGMRELFDGMHVFSYLAPLLYKEEFSESLASLKSHIGKELRPGGKILRLEVHIRFTDAEGGCYSSSFLIGPGLPDIKALHLGKRWGHKPEWEELIEAAKRNGCGSLFWG